MSTSTPKMSRNEFLSSSVKKVVDLIDPRSPTTAFQRTPIQIVLNNSNVSENNASFSNVRTNQSSQASNLSLSSQLDEAEKILGTSSSNSSFISADSDQSFNFVDLSSRDVSVVVSDLSACPSISEKNNETTELMGNIEKQFDQLKLLNTDNLDQLESSTVDDVVIDNSICKNKPLKKPMKKLFYTPNKKRNPLGAVDNVCPVTPTSAFDSPQNVLREKQWKRIQEERKKLGFESDENFQLPLYDVTASAPSKLMLRRQNKPHSLHFS